MNTRLRLFLVLWTALAVAGNAVAGDVGCCDPICCDEPCAPASPGLDSCACCALSGPVSDDPGLPAAPAAMMVPPLAAVPAPADIAANAPDLPVTTPDPPPSRPTVLRI